MPQLHVVQNAVCVELGIAEPIKLGIAVLSGLMFEALMCSAPPLQPRGHDGGST